VWQLVDSAFPTGGYAHSNGLEAAWQHGEVRNAAEVVSFIDASLQQSCYSILPFVSAAHAEPDRLLELDELCDAFTTNHVANRASRLQGCAWAAAVARIFPGAVKSLEAPGPLGRDVAKPVGVPLLPRSRCGHFAPIFGVSTRSLGLSRPMALRLLFFHQLRGLIAAAVRLNIVGGMEAQRIQQRLSGRADDLVALGSSLTLDDIAQTAPLLDVWQGAHDRLYSRLFQS
jgi:urease accessory protein